MEQFSQSRGDEGLFDDEITPIPASQQHGQHPQHEELSQQVQQLKLDQSQTTDRGRGRGRGRGWKRGHGPVQVQTSPDPPSQSDTAPSTSSRGQGRGRGGRGGLAASRFAPKEAVSAQSELAQTDPKPSTEPQASHQDGQVKSQENEDTTAQPPIDAPTGPSTTKTPAVKGDRTATGGVKKPKLSEEELSARLAAAKAKSQAVAEKHARAQADAADFEERERVAKEKRAVEAKEVKKLEGERERNRARKMKALGGREWDAEKNEEDFKAPRYGERTRRGPPAGDEQDMKIYEWRDEDERRGQEGQGKGRGRGRGRGDTRARGRGRGAFNGVADKTPDVKAADDFPALPPKAKEEARKPVPPQRKDSETAGGSWADQMAN